VQLPTAAGTPCDDGRACTVDAVCDGAFTCTGGAEVVCLETENSCTTSICSEAAQGCQEVPVDDSTECGTNDACVSQVCPSGACQSGQTNCPAGDQCDSADCDPGTGRYLQLLTGASCATAGSSGGSCNANGVCEPICLPTVT